VDKSRELRTQSEGASDPAKNWATLEGIFMRSTGASKEFSATFVGLRDRIAKVWDEAKRFAGEPLFVSLEDSMSDLLKDLDANGPRIQKFASGIGESIRAVFESSKTGGIGGITPTLILDAAEAGKLGELLGVVFTSAAKNFGAAIYNAVGTYGPDIQRLLIPQGMWGTLGIRSKEDDAALTRMAAGDIGAFNQLSPGLKTKQMLASGGKNTREGVQRWAQDQVTPFSMMPYVDTAAEVGKVGDKVATQQGLKTMMNEIYNPEWMQAMRGTGTDLAKNLESASASAKTLADNMGNAAAVF
jgi:hypothetical protein